MKKSIFGILLFIISTVVSPHNVSAAIAFTSDLGQGTAAASSAVSITGINASGTDSYIELGVLQETTSRTITSAVLDDGSGGGAQSFTQIGSTLDIEAGNFRLSLWRLIAPTSGAGRRILVTLSGNDNIFIGADYYTGVDQANPTTDPEQAVDASSPGSQLNTSDADGSWQVGVLSAPNGGTSITSGGVKRQDVQNASDISILFDSNTTVANGSANTINWSWTNTHNAGWITHMLRSASSPNITGSGTSNRLAKFTSSTAIGDALLSDDGSNTTLTAGNLLFQPGALIDTISSGVLGIGSSTATTINIGRLGSTITLFGSATLQSFTAQNSTTTSATSTDLYVSNLASTTQLRANTSFIGFLTSVFHTATNLLINGSTTLQNFTALTATTTSIISPSAIFGSIKTSSNCPSSASPATCGSAPAGSVAMAIGGSTLVVNTTAVTANSQILVTEDSSLGTRLGITCNTTTGRIYTISARTVGTSFTIKSSANPATNKACLSYWIVN